MLWLSQTALILIFLFMSTTYAAMPDGHFQADYNNSTYDIYFKTDKSDETQEVYALVIEHQNNKSNASLFMVQEVTIGSQAWVPITINSLNYLTLDTYYRVAMTSNYRAGDKIKIIRTKEYKKPCVTFSDLRLDRVKSSQWEDISPYMNKIKTKDQKSYMTLDNYNMSGEMMVNGKLSMGPFYLDVSITQFIGKIRKAEVDLNSPTGVSIDREVMALLFSTSKKGVKTVHMAYPEIDKCSFSSQAFKSKWKRTFWGN